MEESLERLETHLAEREIYISKLLNDLDMKEKFMPVLKWLYVPCFIAGFVIGVLL
ncbi:hypothetical protein LCGC14_3027940 [marine sediment metagenome]|uniref:Uncharacterized protein n=1 Tax=marine sediment metagenome TaxID=412755 RepID=A0A0F8ZJE7_9ZZZZ